MSLTVEKPEVIDLERRTGVALWRQIADRIRASLGEGLAGDKGKLPAEMTLAKFYGVNRHTVRAAIAVLVQEGILRSEQGRGTFVNDKGAGNDPNNIHAARPSSHDDDPNIELLSSSREPANTEIGNALMIVEGTRVIRLETALFKNKVPVSHSTVWHDAVRFSDIGKYVRAERIMPKALARCGITSYRRHSTIVEARHATSDDIDTLDLSPGGLVLITKVVNIEADGTPIQYAVTRFAADRVTVKIDNNKLAT